MVNHGLLGIFTVEAVIKLTAFGRRYFLEASNIFDLVIVLTSIACVLAASTQSSVVQFFRIIKLFRLFKVVKSFHTMKIISNTVIHTFPAIGNVALLMFLIVFIYSIAGVQLFSEVKH